MTSCDFVYKDNGRFGSSISRQEALKYGSTSFLYKPNKTTFHLLDSSLMTIDTAWTEVMFSYKNGKRLLDSTYGFHFSIPYKIPDPNTFTFTFSLLDTTNRMFTNGREENICRLCPIKLLDEMRVILEQKDTDTSKGWTNPIVTDTIIFRRLKE
jgi:hypothetical protein